MIKFELQDRSRWILTTTMYILCAIVLNIGWTLPFLYGGFAVFPVIKQVLPGLLTMLAIVLFFLGLFIILPIIGVLETDTSDAGS